ncbi:MAG: hypothetical protein AB4057_03340 [Crocosphaera sp.]
MVPLEILAVLLSISFTIVGYFIREYKNRVTPFFETLYIDEFRRYDDDIILSESIINSFQEATYINSLEKETKMANLLSSFESISDFKNFWKEVREKTNQVINSQSDEELIKNLSFLFSLQYFHDLIIYYFVVKSLSCPIKYNSDSEEEIIHIYDDSDDETNGSVLIDFPKHETWKFGNNFKRLFYKEKCQDFLNSIKFLKEESIKTTLREFLKIGQKEYNLSNEIYHPLENLIKLNSRWAMYAYIANINNYPIIVKPKCKIIIRHLNNKFEEECFLTNISYDNNNDLQIEKSTDKPIILASGQDSLIGFMTYKTQKDMEFGDAIRQAFDSGQGLYKIEIIIQKVGLFKEQKYRSNTNDFYYEKSNSR